MIKYYNNLLIYFFIFGAPVVFLPTFLNLTNIAIFLSCMYILFFRKIHLDKLIVFSIPLLLMLLHPLMFFQFDDLDFNKQLFRLFFISLSLFILSEYLVRKQNFKPYDFLKFLSIFLILNSIISIISLFYNDLQKIINSIIIPGMNEGVLDYEKGFRFNGLSGSAGSELSLIYSIYFLFMGLYINKKNSILMLLGGLLVFIGIFFSGRAGLVAAYVLLIYGFVVQKRYWYIIISLIPIIMMILLSYLVYENILVFEEQSVNIILHHSMEPIYKGVFATELSGSNQSLLKMWFLPNDVQTFLFGIGSWRENIITPYGLRAPDPGYMRLMFEHGILLELFTIFFYFIIGFLIKDISNRKIYLGIVVLIAIFHLKEPFLYQDSFFTILALIFYLSQIKQLKIGKNEK